MKKPLNEVLQAALDLREQIEAVQPLLTAALEAQQPTHGKNDTAVVIDEAGKRYPWRKGEPFPTLTINVRRPQDDEAADGLDQDAP